MDGLTVDGGSTLNGTVTINANTTSLILNENDETDENTQLLSAGGTFRIRTRSDDGSTNTERFRVSHNTGDISFYDDTGTSQALFWDASAERLGIGTTSPTRALHINSGTANEVARFESTDTEALIELVDTTGSAQIRSRNDLRFYTNGGSTRAMDISSSGNVGIGTASPAAPLHINQESNAISGTNVDVSNLGLKIINPQNDNDEAVGMGFALSTASSNIGAAIIHQRDDVQSRGSLSFATKGVLGEGADIPIRMTIDSNGNVGIGTTSPTQPLNVLVPDNSGIQIESAAGHKGYLFFGDEASNTRGRIGYDHATDAMGLWTASAEAVVINSSGKVGIGTTSPSATLDLVSSGTNSQNLLDLNSASGIRAKVATDAQDDAYMYLYDSADDLKVAFRTDGNDSYIAGGGNVGIGTSSPSSALDVVGDIEVSGNAKIEMCCCY